MPFVWEKFLAGTPLSFFFELMTPGSLEPLHALAIVFTSVLVASGLPWLKGTGVVCSTVSYLLIVQVGQREGHRIKCRSSGWLCPQMSSVYDCGIRCFGWLSSMVSAWDF